KAGGLYRFELTVQNVLETVRVQWETPNRSREVIPGRYLYSLQKFSDIYIRFMKAASLATGLGSTANEIAHFCVHPDCQINGLGWLNVLPNAAGAPPSLNAALLTPLWALLDFARI